MKRSDLLRTIALVLSLFLLLAGCGGAASQPASQAETPSPDAPASPGAGGEDVFTIGMVVMNFTNPLYNEEMNYIKEAAENIGGMEVIFKSCDSSLEKQISCIENFIEQGVDLIIADPIDTNACVDVFDKATAAGIKMLSNSAPLDTKLESYYLNFEFEKYFGGVAYATFEAMGGKGNVCLLQGQIGHPVNTQRQNGFDEALSHYPDIKVLDQQPCEWDPTTGLTIVENWITTYGDDLDAILCMFDGVTPSLVELVRAKGLEDKILIAGNDGDLRVLEYMKEGAVVADCIFGSSRSSTEAIYFANELLNGRADKNYATVDMYLICSDEIKEKVKASEAPEYNFCTAQEAIDLFNNYATEYREKYGY